MSITSDLVAGLNSVEKAANAASSGLAAVSASALASGLSGLATALAPLTASISSALAPAFSALSSALAPLGATLSAVTASISSALAPLATAFSAVMAPVMALGEVFVGLAAGLAAGVMAGVSAVAGAFQVLAAGVGALYDGFQSLASTIMPFVQAFDPSAVMMFNQIVGDITAVIGQALAPVLNAMTGFLKDFGAVLGPLMESLKPAIDTVVGVLKTFGQSLVAIFGALAPIITMVAEVMAYLAQGIEALTRPIAAWLIVMSTFWTAVGDWLAGLFGGDAKDGMNQFKDAMTSLARVMVLAVGNIAKALGQLAFIDKLQNAFAKQTTPAKDITGTKAAMNPAFMSFDAFGAAIAKNASIATGDDQSKKPEDWLSVISSDLKNLRDDKATFLDEMAAKLEERLSKSAPGRALITVAEAITSAVGAGNGGAAFGKRFSGGFKAGNDAGGFTAGVAVGLREAFS